MFKSLTLSHNFIETSNSILAILVAKHRVLLIPNNCLSNLCGFFVNIFGNLIASRLLQTRIIISDDLRVYVWINYKLINHSYVSYFTEKKMISKVCERIILDIYGIYL